MKEKLKKQKGITLVALVISIIVLLILAGVSIMIVENNGIIKNANNAKQKYIQEEEKEEKYIQNSSELMEQYSNMEINVTELSVPTEDELKEMSYEGSDEYRIAGAEENSSKVPVVYYLATTYADRNSLIESVIIVEDVNENRYIYLLKSDFNDCKAKTWYKLNDVKNFNDSQEYEGKSPIDIKEFKDIKNENYLKNVINSFAK